MADDFDEVEELHRKVTAARDAELPPVEAYAADPFINAHDLVTPPVTQQAPVEKAEFVDASRFLSQYEPFNWLIDGLIVQAYAYSLTSLTQHGKTSVLVMLAVHIALGIPIGGIKVRRGKVAIMAGENPADFRIRLQAAVEAVGADPKDLDGWLYVLPHRFPIVQHAGWVAEKLAQIPDVALVIADTKTAYASAGDENANEVQIFEALAWRSVIERHPAKPALLLACHPVKNATRENLLPRGGGAFANEFDANLTLWKTDNITELGFNKLRQPEFQPMQFRLAAWTMGQYSDMEGRKLTSVVAELMDDKAVEQAEAKRNEDENRLLYALLHHPKESLAGWADACGWRYSDPLKPNKQKVKRTLDALAKDRLVKQYRGRWVLTDSGKREAEGIK